MLSLIPLAATSAAPAVADVPTVCLETTIAVNGRTRKTRIVEGSGDRRDDHLERRQPEREVAGEMLEIGRAHV